MVRLWIVFLEPLLGLSQQSSQGVGWKNFVLTNHPAPHHLSRCGWVGEKISHLRVKHGFKQLCSKMAQGRGQRFRACVLIAILKSWTDCRCQKSGGAPSLTGGGHHHAHKLVTPSLQTLHSKLARSSATVVPRVKTRKIIPTFVEESLLRASTSGTSYPCAMWASE